MGFSLDLVVLLKDIVMYYMVLIMHLCTVTNNPQCVEKHVQYSDMTVTQCNNVSISEMAKYIGEHPEYPVVKDWHCEQSGLEANL